MSEHNSITEQESRHKGLEHKSFTELAEGIHSEDQNAAIAVGKALNQISSLAEAIWNQMRIGGRLFYIGAGTSGRLGILDASECPPTFGVDHDRVIGLIAGGDSAIRKAVENAEDDTAAAWNDLKAFEIDTNDFVVGISASGKTPYVLAGLRDCQQAGIPTGCVVCNPASTIAQVSDYPVEVITGPEFVTGSTRMKAGTAQKMVLNMLTTSVMIKLGHVEDNRMVDMQLSNAKLVKRGSHMIADACGVNEAQGRNLLLRFGSVRKALTYIREHGIPSDI
jgi:N-acetylmuramic acid 6-phosphate etherase